MFGIAMDFPKTYVVCEFVDGKSLEKHLLLKGVELKVSTYRLDNLSFSQPFSIRSCVYLMVSNQLLTILRQIL